MDATDQIRDLLQTYEGSLNTSDAELAASLYTEDAVFMPTTLPNVRTPHPMAGQFSSAIFMPGRSQTLARLVATMPPSSVANHSVAADARSPSQVTRTLV